MQQFVREHKWHKKDLVNTTQVNAMPCDLGRSKIPHSNQTSLQASCHISGEGYPKAIFVASPQILRRKFSNKFLPFFFSFDKKQQDKPDSFGHASQLILELSELICPNYEVDFIHNRTTNQ